MICTFIMCATRKTICYNLDIMSLAKIQTMTDEDDGASAQMENSCVGQTAVSNC